MYADLPRRFPHVTKRMFNAAFIFYAPASLPLDIREQLLALNEEFKAINPTNADQMLLNLLLYDRMEEAGKDCITFFGNDDPGGRVASEYRGWRGDEIPAVLHYTRWHAPWVEKRLLNPETGGYRNHRLGRICHELYAENLAAFEEVFPIV